MPIEFATVEEAAEEFRQGRQIVLVDDEDRENEGDLALAAEQITPSAINFMATHGRGLICVALTEERCDELNLPLIAPSPSWRPSIRPRARPIWRAPATSSRCARGAAACWVVPGRRKPPWT